MAVNTTARAEGLLLSGSRFYRAAGTSAVNRAAGTYAHNSGIGSTGSAALRVLLLAVNT